MNAIKPTVQLVSYTPLPEILVSSAAKLCYASDTKKILDQDSEESANFIGRLMTLGHMSPIEHVSFTFLLEGISRALTHQLVRHRLASYSQRSQRYVAEDEFDYIMPPSFIGKEVDLDGHKVSAEEFFKETMCYLAKRYKLLNESLGRKGESTNQDARYVLPNACETKIFVTMNARELRHFFEERMCSRAQWEIRGVATTMRQKVFLVAPALFKKSGPKCVRLGKCPEGKMSCGKFEEMKSLYS